MLSVAIIGGGCAGLTAAIYCARANLSPTVFAGSFNDKGGLLTKTSVVENYPGFPNGIDGFDLIVNMEEQAKNFGASIIDVEIVNINISTTFILTDSNGKKYAAQSVIIATGSKPNKLGLPNEDLLWGKGISSCAVCDGALYKNKRVTVIGGGDSACEAALFLTKYTTDVTMYLRGSKFRASEIMKSRVLQFEKDGKIKIQYNTNVVGLVYGEDDEKLSGRDLNYKLAGIMIEYYFGADQNYCKHFVPVDGLFYGLGLTPNSKLLVDIHTLGKTETNHIIQLDGTTRTSIPGLFSAGDVSDERYRQAVVACADGCKAALDVIEYLNNNYSTI